MPCVVRREKSTSPWHLSHFHQTLRSRLKLRQSQSWPILPLTGKWIVSRKLSPDTQLGWGVDELFRWICSNVKTNLSSLPKIWLFFLTIPRAYVENGFCVAIAWRVRKQMQVDIIEGEARMKNYPKRNWAAIARFRLARFASFVSLSVVAVQVAEQSRKAV